MKHDSLEQVFVEGEMRNRSLCILAHLSSFLSKDRRSYREKIIKVTDELVRTVTKKGEGKKIGCLQKLKRQKKNNL